MSTLTASGNITKILPIENGISKSGADWSKLNFIINTSADFNPEICFEIFKKEKCDKFLADFQEGDFVKVSFNVSSREYNGKYYHNISAWKVEKGN